MALIRKLEVEVMDTDEDASDYDAMDHSSVNQLFVQDLLAAGLGDGDILDLGTGTAQIPIELCHQKPEGRILAVDAAVSMLDIARINVEVAGLRDRITLAQVDAKKLPYREGMFATVMSNSIVHHIPEPLIVLREAVRVTMPGGRLFFRDLLRPRDEPILRHLVDTYAADANAHQRQLFADSLHAALDLAEVQDLVAQLGFDPADVQPTSDRHWTWCARKKDSA